MVHLRKVTSHVHDGFGLLWIVEEVSSDECRDWVHFDVVADHNAEAIAAALKRQLWVAPSIDERGQRMLVCMNAVAQNEKNSRTDPCTDSFS